MNLRHLLASVALGALLLPFVGCDTIEVLVDCQAICDKYADCFDPDASVSECRDRCEENADDEDYAASVDDCEACIDDKTCAASAVECATDCAGIVQ